jgi:mRNA interferase YafQ
VYNIEYTGRFKKDYKLVLSRGYNESHIQKVITLIVNKSPLPAKYKAHKLSGDFKDCWECHINPDWLLIWGLDEANNTMTLIRTGTHSDLF